MNDTNKMTGYALAHLATNTDGRLVDPRVNPDSPLLTGQARLADFLEHLSGVDALTHAGPELAEDEPVRAVVHDPVGGIPGVLMIRPAWLPSWHRVGDDLDRAGELGAPGARLEFLPSAMWPYSAQFMDAATGNELGEEVLAFVRAIQSGVPDLDDAAKDALARATTGFATFAEAERRVVAAVPSAVRALVEWGELFTEPAVVNQLRPALYTWWS